jgi:outer membrane protein
LNADALALRSVVYDPEEHYREMRQNWFGLSITHADGRRELLDAPDPEGDPKAAE